jgi:hypothetical protein
MLKYSLLATILFCSVSHSQTHFVKFLNTDCKQNHRCGIKQALNRSDSGKTYMSPEINLGDISFTQSQPLAVSFIKAIDENKNAMTAAVFSGNVKDCTNRTSYVTILQKSGARRQLMCVAPVYDCHSNYITVGLTDTDVEALQSDAIMRVRLHYVNKEEDFEVDDKGKQKFIETLKCISAIK